METRRIDWTVVAFLVIVAITLSAWAGFIFVGTRSLFERFGR